MIMPIVEGVIVICCRVRLIFFGMNDVGQVDGGNLILFLWRKELWQSSLSCANGFHTQTCITTALLTAYAVVFYFKGFSHYYILFLKREFK